MLYIKYLTVQLVRFPFRGTILEELTDKSSHYYRVRYSASYGFVLVLVVGGFFLVLNNIKRKK